MTTANLVSEIVKVFPGATMVRRNKSNFLAVPGDIVDGVQTYHSIRIGALSAKDTERSAAFDFEAAAAEYAEWKKNADEKAAQPKSPKKTPDPEKAAAKKARQDALLAWMVANPGLHTSAEIADALVDVYTGSMALLTVGTDASALVKAGEITCETIERKKHYGFQK